MHCRGFSYKHKVLHKPMHSFCSLNSASKGTSLLGICNHVTPVCDLKLKVQLLLKASHIKDYIKAQNSAKRILTSKIAKKSTNTHLSITLNTCRHYSPHPPKQNTLYQFLLHECQQKVLQTYSKAVSVSKCSYKLQVMQIYDSMKLLRIASQFMNSQRQLGQFLGIKLPAYVSSFGITVILAATRIVFSQCIYKQTLVSCSCKQHSPACMWPEHAFHQSQQLWLHFKAGTWPMKTHQLEENPSGNSFILTWDDICSWKTLMYWNMNQQEPHMASSTSQLESTRRDIKAIPHLLSYHLYRN